MSVSARNSILHFNMSDPHYPIAGSAHTVLRTLGQIMKLYSVENKDQMEFKWI